MGDMSLYNNLRAAPLPPLSPPPFCDHVPHDQDGFRCMVMHDADRSGGCGIDVQMPLHQAHSCTLRSASHCLSTVPELCRRGPSWRDGKSEAGRRVVTWRLWVSYGLCGRRVLL